jgi:hypothetical protein
VPLFDSSDPNAGRPLASSGVPPGRFRMWRSGEGQTKDPWRVHCLLGGERPRPIRGYGGWTTLPREGRRSKSTFGGTETPAYSITLRLDRSRPTSTPVAEQMRDLERLCGWDRADDDPPPVVQWTANVAHDFAEASQNEWVCESLEWGDSNSSDRGTLLWMEATVVLGLYDESSTGGLAKSKGFARHTLKAGWNLRHFAKVHLGDAKRWRDVADLNRDNPRCPSTAEYRVKRPVVLLTPPREPVSKTKTKRARRGK